MFNSLSQRKQLPQQIAQSRFNRFMLEQSIVAIIIITYIIIK